MFFNLLQDSIVLGPAQKNECTIITQEQRQKEIA